MNQTTNTDFMLLGFQNLQMFKPAIFALCLVIYILTLVWNVLIIVLVANVQRLKSPMYFFLTQLSLSDILLSTDIVPNLLHVIINGGSPISIIGCIAQLYFYGISAGTECLLLTVMSYDRYLAICRPLHYSSIMNLKLQIQMALWSWAAIFIIMLFIAFFVGSLKFCPPLVIDHYFCDLAPVLELSCSKQTTFGLIHFSLSVLIIICPFVYIMFTYVSIFTTISRISASRGKEKAFSTCSSHLIVVSTYYGTLMVVYMVPSEGQSYNVNKAISLLYSMVPPFLNPTVYCLRNQEIKEALLKTISNQKLILVSH